MIIYDALTSTPKKLQRDGNQVMITDLEDTGKDAKASLNTATRLVLSPGWIDIQINGFMGVDFNQPVSTADLLQAVEALAAVGVTRFLPTVITHTPAHMEACLQAIARATQESERIAQAVVGIHLEGPFLSAQDGARGAHPREAIRPPDLALFERLQEASGQLVRLLTLSPEYEEAAAFIHEITNRGVRVAIGHTSATPEQIQQAVQAGASLSTHLGNGIQATLARHPNILWEQLAQDKLFTSAIFDGFHLPTSTLKVFHKVKGTQLIMVSDAVALAGMSPGVYKGQIGGQVELHPSGKLTMYGSEYLAGSASSLLAGVNTAIHNLGCTLADVFTMVSTTPQHYLGLPERADYVVMASHTNTGQWEIVMTIVDGEIVYQNQDVDT
ncbi:MAG: amidohydrolase family protein [Deinococcota bacterium]